MGSSTSHVGTVTCVCVFYSRRCLIPEDEMSFYQETILTFRHFLTVLGCEFSYAHTNTNRLLEISTGIFKDVEKL